MQFCGKIWQISGKFPSWSVGASFYKKSWIRPCYFEDLNCGSTFGPRPISLFLFSFLGKIDQIIAFHAHLRSWRPREILDLPLRRGTGYFNFIWFNFFKQNMCHGLPDLPTRGRPKDDHSSAHRLCPLLCSGRQPDMA